MMRVCAIEYMIQYNRNQNKKSTLLFFFSCWLLDGSRLEGGTERGWGCVELIL